MLLLGSEFLTWLIYVRNYKNFFRALYVQRVFTNLTKNTKSFLANFSNQTRFKQASKSNSLRNCETQETHETTKLRNEMISCHPISRQSCPEKSVAQIQPTQETTKLQNEMIRCYPISRRSCRLPAKCPPKPLANDIPSQEL